MRRSFFPRFLPTFSFLGAFRLALVSVLAPTLTAPPPVAAQTIRGMVFDESSGAPLRGASVDALDARLQAVGRVVTDMTGQYALTLPDTGYYVVSASMSGYAATAPEQVWLGPGEEITVMLGLRSTEAASDSAGGAGGDDAASSGAGVTMTESAREGSTGYIYGQVVEKDGNRPVVNADVQVKGGAAGTMTNGAGRFAIREVEPGEVRLRFEHLSFAPQETKVEVEAGMAYEVSVRMDPDPVEVEGIEVETRSRFVARRLEPVYARMGMGTNADFLTKEAFEMRGMPPVGQMLRGLLSVKVRNYGSQWNITIGRAARIGEGGCVPAVYLDGMRVAKPEDQPAISEFLSMSTFDVEVVEVYKGPASLPPEFNDPGTLCAIGIWTRRGG